MFNFKLIKSWARSPWLATLAVAIAAGVLLMQRDAVEAQDSGQARGATAVVDLEAVVQRLAEQEEFRGALEKRQNTIKQRQQAEQAEVENLQNALRVLKPGSDDHTKKQEELMQRVIEYQAWLQFEQQRLQRDSTTHIMNLYRKSSAAASELAKSGGYEVLLFRQGEPDYSQLQAKELSTVIQNRKVLWADPKVDLTDQVVQQMNNAYANRGG